MHRAAGQQNKRKKQPQGQLPGGLSPAQPPSRQAPGLFPRRPAPSTHETLAHPKVGGHLLPPEAMGPNDPRGCGAGGGGQLGFLPCLSHQAGPPGPKTTWHVTVKIPGRLQRRAPQERGVWECSSPRTLWGWGQAWGTSLSVCRGLSQSSGPPFPGSCKGPRGA